MPSAQATGSVSDVPRETATSAPGGACEHCGTAVPMGATNARFCCHGCEAVHDLLLEQGLGRYYELARGEVTPVATAPAQRSHTWLDPLIEQAQTTADGDICSLTLDVQGVHCAACVWLMNETFRRQQGAAEITVNPALGKVRLLFKKGQTDLARWVRDVEGFGYQFGPARKETSKKSIDLPLRLGVSAAITINVMLFSVSFYFGLVPDAEGVFSLFTWLSLALSTVTVFVGGWPFFNAALRGIKSGMLHLDLPIAVGIILVYAMSLVQMRTGRGDLTYFDTLNTFITLMLLGRFLQERLLERNRRFLLDDDGAEGLVVRKVVGEKLVPMKAPKVQANDVLLVAPGDVVPVDATLLDAAAHVSTDWITGESKARQLSTGAEVPAGSFNAGRTAFHVLARTGFTESPLVQLLRQPPSREGKVPEHHHLWNDLARKWVVKVLLVSGAGFLVWLPSSFDEAVNVAASLLVITCPCAIGIAIPLAYEITQTHLRRAGFFVRSSDLLDRLVKVKKVLFDKTGTLTLGRLELVDASVLTTMDAVSRDIAWNLAVRSSHPVSGALARALEGHGVKYEVTASVEEVQGQGMEWRRADGLWRLGRAGWAVPGTTEHVTLLSRDGALVARLETREALRTDARKELAWLTEHGFDVWLISGDDPSRVAAMAETLGVAADHALGGQRPEQKAETVSRLDAGDTLFLGDGVNDSLAFERALIAGTPAIDRPVMPGRSDFFLVGEGLSPIKESLARAAHLRAVVKKVLMVSLTYNAFAICLALLGKMSPLLAAITMPASTLTLLVITIVGLEAYARATTASDTVMTQNPRVAQEHS
ncbi:MAG: heavy metal translocating P-type ATPase metal-binding domain-containing protein [Myxococcales bacterium]|nr:heavy metal translocating P-type ATPase metal-binding domain-containing protein [Myxococcales bacterium]